MLKSALTAADTYKVGDLVIPDPDAYGGRVTPEVHKVVSVPRTAREKNYRTAPLSGMGQGVRGPASVLLAWTGTEAEAREFTGFEFEVPEPAPVVGTVVRVTGDDRIDPNTLYVVLGDAKRWGNARLAKLGGDRNRYWTAIPNKALTVVDLSRITVAPE